MKNCLWHYFQQLQKKSGVGPAQHGALIKKKLEICLERCFKTISFNTVCLLSMIIGRLVTPPLTITIFFADIDVRLGIAFYGFASQFKEKYYSKQL